MQAAYKVYFSTQSGASLYFPDVSYFESIKQRRASAENKQTKNIVKCSHKQPPLSTMLSRIVVSEVVFNTLAAKWEIRHIYTDASGVQ